MISPYIEGDFVLDLHTTNDPPGHLAAHWMGLTYDEWSAAHRDRGHPQYEHARIARIAAKEVLFPYLYGTRMTFNA